MTDQYTTVSLDQLQEIISTMMHAAEANSLRQTLQRIAHASRKLVGARYAALGIPDNHGGLRYFEVSGMSEKEIASVAHPPIGAGLLGLIMNEQQTLRMDFMQDHPRAVGFPEGHPQMTSLLGVPIKAGEQLFGMMYLTDREDDMPFSQYDQWLVETIAGYAALAIAGTQLREQQKRLSTLEERQRIGMELHDGVIQSLYALGMHLDLLRNNEAHDKQAFQPIIDGLNAVIEDVRSYIMDLKAANGDRSLYQIFSDVIARLYVPESLNLVIDAPDTTPPFPPPAMESISFIAREAISNAIRHSEANNVTVRAWIDAKNFQLVIRDDGIGFSPDHLESDSGLGLRNIQERVRRQGGVLVINSMRGQGTAIMLTIPLKRGDPE